MATAIDKWIDVIGRLLQLTQTGKLDWRVVPASDSLMLDPKDRLSTVYGTNHNNKELRLFRRLYSEYRALTGFGRNTTVLAIVDDDDTLLWTFPEVDIADDLLFAVQYRVAGVQEFVDSVLAEVW